MATFAPETAWTTEGIIHFADCNSNTNPVMTHNLPRWASHGSFDFQYKGEHTLLGIFERVDLIRSLIMREAGKEELKTFDKHIFDETLEYTTAAKKILLNTAPKSVTDQQNLWTWTQDLVYARARAEFGLREEPMTPWLFWNYWVGWTLDSYYRDLLPAARAIGIKGLFIDGVNRNDYSEYHGYPEGWTNMCNGQEYEISAKVGGPPAMKRFIDECLESGITRAYSWTNNDQSYLSANTTRHPEWFVRMEDSRLRYGGAYTNVLQHLELRQGRTAQLLGGVPENHQAGDRPERLPLRQLLQPGLHAGGLYRLHAAHLLAADAGSVEGAAGRRRAFPHREFRPVRRGVPRLPEGV